MCIDLNIAKMNTKMYWCTDRCPILTDWDIL